MRVHEEDSEGSRVGTPTSWGLDTRTHAELAVA